ncbi:molybdopterin molybdotransferase MoeA [Arcobacter sp. FWKO B]|uniref:molybdopterin molybdotransferase MoeA n=1 Tax=Arcobacter sp. FWKO B TaxID=2593672 RepID=UPI0018A6216D|nr:molybdopterin molybdotransferase MoeA [Arcobacter sp. FWKO B]QOG11397.1 molybdopterin molybdotransferase MoeA [Arcobacter sp. FWKO B]
MSKLTYKESLEKIINLKVETTTSKVYLMDSLGKILAHDIKALKNSPAFPTAAMDGYAINLSLNETNNEFSLVDISPAGVVVQTQIAQNNCIKTFTGSLMPKGSDTLVPIENIEIKDNKIYIQKPVPIGFAVMGVGENYKENEVLIPKGTKIDFAHIGVMASLNIVFVEVFNSPIVGICSTGTEILDIGEVQTNESQIRSSNHLTLEAIAKKYNCHTRQLGLIEDNKDSISQAIKNGLSSCDIVVTTGGVSVGDYDFVKDIVIGELSADIVFKGVDIKPGMHIIVAQLGNKFICSLPGFAYSSTVTFLLYCLPIIFKFRGSYESLEILSATAKTPYKNTTQKTVFVASNLTYTKSNRYEIDTNGKKSGTSAILTNLLNNSVLAILEPNKCYDSGEEISFIKL